jgi:hemerythrin
MPWFNWSDDFLTGTHDIDEQHRRLVALVDEFYSALGQSDANLALGRLLYGLLEYTRYHFSTEERYMMACKYPDAEHHVGQHAMFVAKVQDISNQFNKGEVVLSLAITAYLRDWLSQHILGADKRLGRFLADRQTRTTEV